MRNAVIDLCSVLYQFPRLINAASFPALENHSSPRANHPTVILSLTTFCLGSIAVAGERHLGRSQLLISRLLGHGCRTVGRAFATGTHFPRRQPKSRKPALLNLRFLLRFLCSIRQIGHCVAITGHDSALRSFAIARIAYVPSLYSPSLSLLFCVSPSLKPDP
jgi:hypothetical protein